MARSRNGPSIAVGICAALLTASVLGGCQLTGGRIQQASKPAATPMAEYASRVEVNVNRARDAIAQIAEAKSFGDLQQRVAAALETVRASSASMRSMQNLPDGTKSAHDRLAALLSDLQFEIIATSTAVRSQEVCAAPSAIKRLNQSGVPGKVDAAVQELSAVTGGQFEAVQVVPVSKAAIRRPGSGTLVRGRLNGPRLNYLTVDNKDGGDVVLTFSRSSSAKKPFLSVFVRGKSKITIRGIPNGAYRSYGTGGKDWDTKLRTFSRDCGFWRYKGRSDWSGDGRGWVYSFGGKPRGEGGTEDVPPADAVQP